MKLHIGISGSYGGMNLGDEAILESILQQLRSTFDVDVVVFSFNHKDTEKRHKVRAIPFREMHKDQVIEELNKLDLFIFGGGGILFDGYVESFLRDVIWAKELGIPVMVYAISVGPLKKQESKEMVVEVLNRVDIITVRESDSKRILNDLGVIKDIVVSADPAFLLKPNRFTKEMLTKEGIDPNKPLVGISVREPGPAAPDLNIDHYHGVLANCADFMIERFDAQILFVPMEQGANRDPQHSHAVISKMLNVQKVNVLKGEYTAPQLLGLIKHFSFAVGMRLHFLIFAGLQNVPFIPLPYASKVKGFLEDLEMISYPIEEWNTGKLCAMIDRGWDNRKAIKKKLKEKIPLITEKAKQTHIILSDLIKSLTQKK